MNAPDRLAEIKAHLAANLGGLANPRPYTAHEPGVCWLCGKAPAVLVVDGTLPDGGRSAFVPSCQGCYDNRRVKEAPK